MLKPKWRNDAIRPLSSAMARAHQRYRHDLAIKRGKPFSGAYYWVPDALSRWSLLVFPNAFYEGGEAGHVDVWEEVIQVLSHWHECDPGKLRKTIENCPYGLPRGRVVRMGNGDWGVAHGNDHPAEHPFQEMIVENFCLSEVSPRFFFDDHEQMLEQDQILVCHALGLSAP